MEAHRDSSVVRPPHANHTASVIADSSTGSRSAQRRRLNRLGFSELQDLEEYVNLQLSDLRRTGDTIASAFQSCKILKKTLICGFQIRHSCGMRMRSLMLIRIFLAILLPLAGIIAVFAVYLCLLWYMIERMRTHTPPPSPERKISCRRGLSAGELEELPIAAALEDAHECVICLEVIEQGQRLRLLPTCNHAFHLLCVDAWLSLNAVCPVCQRKLAVSEFRKEAELRC